MKFRLTTSAGQTIAVHGSRLISPLTTCDTDISLGSGGLYPGLINAHDHLHRNHYPRLGDPPYGNAYEWGDDLHSRFNEQLASARKVNRNDALLFGALKNLIAGVTSVVHHDAWEQAFEEQFPVHVVPLANAHSLRLAEDLTATVERARASRRPFAIHAAEGTDASMANEIRELHDRGMIDDLAIAIHAVGVDREGIKILDGAGAAVVWCPSSNIFLYGQTASSELLNSQIDILLGSDALVSGEGTLLRELQVARHLNLMSEERLQAAVGATAATRLGLEHPALTPGSRANVVFLRRPLDQAQLTDVSLVLVEGLPKVGDIEHRTLFELCDVETELLELGGVRKLVVAPLGHVAREVVGVTPACARIFEEGAVT